MPAGLRNAGTIALATAAAFSAGMGWWSLWAGGWASGDERNRLTPYTHGV